MPLRAMLGVPRVHVLAAVIAFWIPPRHVGGVWRSLQEAEPAKKQIKLEDPTWRRQRLKNWG